MTGAPSLVVSLLRGAMTSGVDDETETFELTPGEIADRVVERIDALMTRT
jgi:hypothetical protein